MITVEKAIKSNKLKNATEAGSQAKKSNKKKLLIYLGIGALALYVGSRILKGNKDGTEKISAPNT
jgi:hypothetical protein